MAFVIKFNPASPGTLLEESPILQAPVWLWEAGEAGKGVSRGRSTQAEGCLSPGMTLPVAQAVAAVGKLLGW